MPAMILSPNISQPAPQQMIVSPARMPAIRRKIFPGVHFEPSAIAPLLGSARL
jgi:hypothetical protein